MSFEENIKESCNPACNLSREEFVKAYFDSIKNKLLLKGKGSLSLNMQAVVVLPAKRVEASKQRINAVIAGAFE